MVEDGYEFFAKRQLVTLFSAPNYCGEFDNAGAMMSVDETLMCSFQVGLFRPHTKHADRKSTRQATITAIPNPNKDHTIAASYRPISLLSVCYKCLELLLPQCANPTLEDFIRVEQAGFRKGRTTCDQVLALATFVENG